MPPNFAPGSRLGAPLPGLACCPRRLERRLRGCPRRCLAGWRLALHGGAIHPPAPGMAAADGKDAVDAAALIDDAIVVGGVAAVGPSGAAVFEHHAASIAIAQTATML